MVFALFQIKIQLKIVQMSLTMYGIVANSKSETQITNFPSVVSRGTRKLFAFLYFQWRVPRRREERIERGAGQHLCVYFWNDLLISASLG